MTKPSITIIFHVKNEAFFEVSIRSILSQSFVNFRCIICPAGTGSNLLSAYKIDDQRLSTPASVIEDQHTNCIETPFQIQSKYICFVDTDDQLHPHYLEKLINYMEQNPKWSCGHCGLDFIDKNWNLLSRKIPYAAQKTKVSLFRNNEIVLSSLIFRSSFLKKNALMYNWAQRRSSEYGFLVSISKITAIKPIDEVLLKHVIGIKNDKTAYELREDQIRLLQLHSLNPDADGAQCSFHLKLMKNGVLEKAELQEALNWLNYLLELNQKLKIYQSGLLYQLFEDILFMRNGGDLINYFTSVEMNRTSLINLYIQNFNYKSYLEIGVFDPKQNFDHINCKLKIGVDPQPHRVDIVGLTSDQYFEKLAQDEKFDIIFIDGLHHYEQVIRDVFNALNHLNENGTIICHDMLPSTEIMQEVPMRTQEWTGDCWKAWSYFRMNWSNLEMSVVNADYGLGIIRRGSQKCFEPLLNISELDYQFFLVNKQQLLNIIEPSAVQLLDYSS
jgi:glycosyltransferase involved in cell wall biosynthesis